MKHKESGVVEVVGDVQSGTGKTGRAWRKRDIIVNIAPPGGQWPNPVKVTFWNDKETRAAALSVGDEVDVEFVLRGSEFNERFKVELNGMDVTVTKASNAPKPEPAPAAIDEEPASDDPDDLPF